MAVNRSCQPLVFFDLRACCFMRAYGARDQPRITIHTGMQNAYLGSSSRTPPARFPVWFYILFRICVRGSGKGMIRLGYHLSILALTFITFAFRLR